MILFVNACVRDDSRTKLLALHFLSLLHDEYTERDITKTVFPQVDEAFLNHRDALIEAEHWEDPLFDDARQFAAADRIVIAAPYWDLSFPASVKQYFEQINVRGITFRYSPDGKPIALCKAKRLDYITTAGGSFLPEEYGFGYVKALAENFYGIEDVRLHIASGLDIAGADPKQILDDTIDHIVREV